MRATLELKRVMPGATRNWKRLSMPELLHTFEPCGCVRLEALTLGSYYPREFILWFIIFSFSLFLLLPCPRLMSDDDVGGGKMAHLQEFQAIVLPPVPRPANNNNLNNSHHNHIPTSASSSGERRTGPTTQTTMSSNSAVNRVHHNHGSSTSHREHHGHHAQHSSASEPYPTSKPSSSSNKGGVRGRVTVVCAEVSIT